MASAQDRWLFLLAFAPLPLACADDAPQDPAEGSSSGTTAAPPSTSTGTTDAEGSTTIVTTGVDGTSSSGDDGSTTAVDGSTTEPTSASSSEGTTMSVEPGTSSSSEEGSSSTGEPQGLCEVWAETLAMCYGYYYQPQYLVQYCYDYLTNVDLLCVPPAAQYYQCQASGCFVDCNTQYQALQECNDLLLAQQLGCDMIPIVPSVGTTPMQCMGFVDVVELCTAGGYYIPFFTFYVNYNPYYAQYACVNGWVLAGGFVPPGAGDSCGGAYEELLTCLSGLPCGQLENAIFSGGGGACAAQHDAVTCRCELGA
jgi:hypothetical protein